MPTNIYGRRVIIRVNPEVSERLDDITDLRRIPSELDRNLSNLLRTYEVPALRLVSAVPVAKIRRQERKARANHWPLEHSLTDYWVLDTRDMPIDDTRQLASRIRRQSRISWSWIRGRQSEAGQRRTAFIDASTARPQEQTDPRGTFPRSSGCRNYLAASPCGINASFAWNKELSGSGTRLVDLEDTWDLEHHAFDALKWIDNPKGPRVPLYNDNMNQPYPRHGTMVLSVVAGTDEGVRLKGIAEGAECGVVSTYRNVDNDDRDVVGAIVAAVEVLRSGDILLLECSQRSKLPLEVMEHYHDAIRLAVGNGIIVIEAAGNGGHDLDAKPDPASEWSPSVRLSGRYGQPLTDSGAIVVGACEDRCVRNPQKVPLGHRTLWNSNYGSRVNCYAWGQGVTSSVDEGFGGTSAASAIIAGAAILTQQMHVRSGGGRLSPAEMRELLSDPEVGVPSQPTEDGTEHWIGVMPDLEKVWGKVSSRWW
jgi:hypothetical protein